MKFFKIALLLTAASALLLCCGSRPAAAAALFEDGTAQSSFVSPLIIRSPIVAPAATDGATLDLDDDGVDEILISGVQVACFGQVLQTTVFVKKDSKYVQVDYGKQYYFLGVDDIVLYKFQRLQKNLPDLITCALRSSVYSMQVLRNHGALNFSLDFSPFLGLGSISCDDSTSLAVGDTNRDSYGDFFLSTSSEATFWMQLSNRSFVPSLMPLPISTPFKQSSVAFGDLDGDLYPDIVWSGFKHVVGSQTRVFRNIPSSGYNFSLAMVFEGANYPTVVVEELTGDARPDILLGGMSSSAFLLLFENNGSMSFVKRLSSRLDISGVYIPSVAVVPLSSQSKAFDVSVVPFTRSSYNSISGIFVNNGSGYFEHISSPSESFFGSVILGPSYQSSVRNTVLAFGVDDENAVEGSTMCGVYEGGSFRNVLSEIFTLIPRDMPILLGGAYTFDFNYDDCADAFYYGTNGISSYSYLLTGNCLGALKTSAANLPGFFYGGAVFKDFDLDGLLDAFLCGQDVDNQVVASYYTFESDGNALQNPDRIPALYATTKSAVCSGNVDGSPFPDIVVFGAVNDSSSAVVSYLRNNHSGYFTLDSSLSIGITPFLFGSCLFVDRGNASLYNDLVAIGGTNVAEFFFYRNLLNSTLADESKNLFTSDPPLGVVLGSIVFTDFNGDSLPDLFYNGLTLTIKSSISALYFQRRNGSMDQGWLWGAESQTSLYYSSTVAMDVNSDGLIDLILMGENFFGNKVLAALINDGTANFTDQTAAVFGQQPGASQGGLVAALFSNDSLPDLFIVGSGTACGPRVLLQQLLGNSSGTTALPSSSSSSSSSSFPLGAIVGLSAGTPVLLALLCTLLCCIICLLCICLICIAATVAIAVVIVSGTAVVGFVAVADVPLIYVLLRRRGANKASAAAAAEDVDVDVLDVVALRAEAERVGDFVVIDWSHVRTIRKLGAGAYGDVFLAEWNGVEVAVKYFRSPTKDAVQEFRQEALMMAKVSHHPNMVHFIGASFPRDGMAMVLGLCSGGSLLEALGRNEYTAARKSRALREVASALAFLHSLGIVHRDVAARNVLLDGRGRAKLSDLGLSRVLENLQDELQTKSSVGPVRWMAPESIRDHKYSIASDCYSFGVLMCEVWSNGTLPLGNLKSVAEVAIAVLQNGARPHIAEETPPGQASLIRQLFSANPEHRPTMEIVQRELANSAAEFSRGDGGSESEDHDEMDVSSSDEEPSGLEYCAAVEIG